MKVWTIGLSGTGIPDRVEQDTPTLAEWTVVYNVHKLCVNAIDVSVNDQLVATASRDKTVKVRVCCTLH